MRKPDFFIVGAPRSGTTSMKRALWEHPEIFLVAGAPNFFGTDLYQSAHIIDEEAYLSLFVRAKKEKRVGEKSAWYFMSKRAAAEIKEFQPSASIIIMLRNPVDVLYSLHSYHVHTTGHEDILDFEVALEAEEDRRRGLRIPNGICSHENWLLLYRDAVSYTRQVRQYLDAFSRGQVHIIVFDDFVGDTAGVYRDTLRFLGVTPDFQPDFRKTNANMRSRSRTLENFLIRPPMFVRSLGEVVTQFSLGRRVLWSLASLNSHDFSREPLNPELRRRLQAKFLPEVEQLSQLLDRDLTHWCQSD